MARARAPGTHGSVRCRRGQSSIVPERSSSTRGRWARDSAATGSPRPGRERTGRVRDSEGAAGAPGPRGPRVAVAGDVVDCDVTATGVADGWSIVCGATPPNQEQQSKL